MSASGQSNHSHDSGDRRSDPAFLLRVIRVLGLAAGLVLAVLLLLNATDVLLLAFAGALIAILLRAPADLLTRLTRLPHVVSVILSALLMGGTLIVLGWLTLPQLLNQVAQVGDRLPEALDTVEEMVRELGGEEVDVELSRLMPSPDILLGRVPGIIRGTLGVIAGFFVALVLGLYTAAYPQTYVDGFVRLFPIERRSQVKRVLGEIHHVLRRFLVGHIVSMVAVGLLTYIGLLILDIPVALGLAVLTALLEFIPYLGPILAVLPAVLLALTVSPLTALYVLIVYLVVQQAESHLITPVVQHRAVYLPPALIILTQTLMGVLFGLLGVLLATPLAAAGLVAVKRLYIEPVLGDEAESEGGGGSRSEGEGAK